MIDVLRELIEGGFIGQAIIGSLIWGLIAFLIVMKASVDNRLYDAGFIVIGYLFHMAQTAATTHAKAKALKASRDCADTPVDNAG